MVPSGARVADVGTDHGYLGIHLLQHRLASYVAACDLRPGPLNQARQNAQCYGVAEQMDFFLCDGLAAVPPESVDTVVCAGMGADLMIHILSDAPWLADSRYTLVLQPQKGGQDLRRWLVEHGFAIVQEDLVRDSGFLYNAMQARPGRARALSPGEQFISPVLLASGSALLPEYMQRISRSLQGVVTGMLQAESPAPQARLAYYQQALREVQRMEEEHAKGIRDT